MRMPFLVVIPKAVHGIDDKGTTNAHVEDICGVVNVMIAKEQCHIFGGVTRCGLDGHTDSLAVTSMNLFNTQHPRCGEIYQGDAIPVGHGNESSDENDGRDCGVSTS